jgi:hypothetical protein
MADPLERLPPRSRWDSLSLILSSLSLSVIANPVSSSVTRITAAALVLWVQISALTTLHLRLVSTALTSERRPGRSVPVNSMTLWSDAAATLTDLRREGMYLESAPRDYMCPRIDQCVSVCCQSRIPPWMISYIKDCKSSPKKASLLNQVVELYLSNVVFHLCNGCLIFEFLPFLVGHIEDWELIYYQV